MTAVPEAVYDPVLKRYRATCPHCGYVSVRAKREAAEHNLSTHLAYQHDEFTTRRADAH